MEKTLFDDLVQSLKEAKAIAHTHKAAAYDTWFHEQVDAAISEADDPATAWVSEDNASASWDAQHAKLLTRIAGEAK